MRAALDSVSFQIRVETFDDCTMLFALSEFTHSVYGYSNVTGTTPFRFWEPNWDDTALWVWGLRVPFEWRLWCHRANRIWIVEKHTSSGVECLIQQTDSDDRSMRCPQFYWESNCLHVLFAGCVVVSGIVRACKLEKLVDSECRVWPRSSLGLFDIKITP